MSTFANQPKFLKHSQRLSIDSPGFRTNAAWTVLLGCLLIAMPAAQSQSYTPGQPIKFGGAHSPIDSSTASTSDWNNGSQNSGAQGSTNSSFSGTTYAPTNYRPPSITDANDTSRNTQTGSVTSSSSGSSSSASSSSSRAINYSTPDTSDQGKHHGGLSSLFRGVKQEIQNANINGNGSSLTNTYVRSSDDSTPGYHFGGSSMTNLGYQKNSSAGGGSDGNRATNWVRMPDGSYRANGPNAGNTRPSPGMSKISGNASQIVSSDMPVNIDGDIENMIPRELHAKAYGNELRRNGPLNGAEDNDHLY